MLTLIALALVVPQDLPAQHFDRIDVNHVITIDGNVRFSQLIFWRWVRDEKRFVSFGFVFLKDGQKEPRTDRDGASVVVTKDGKRWRVTSDCVIETRTRNDPEQDDRCRYPDFRREWE